MPNQRCTMTSEKTNQQWLLVKRPTDLLSEENFELKKTKLEPLKDGQFLLQNCYLSFDPTQRIWSSIDSYMPKVPLGDVMRAFGMGQVIESKSKRYKPGDIIFTDVGWQQYKLIDSNEKELVKPVVIPGFLDPVTMLALSITGFTAYLGIAKLAKVKAGDEVLVSGAAGAVGSMVCQIAKLKGARVIGIAGGPEKCDYLLHELGIDEAIDYKNGDVCQKIDEKLPEGLDIYFDNVGGEILDHALTKIKKHARIILCGAISQYHDINQQNIDEGNVPATKNIFNLIAHSATMQGLVLTDYMHEMPTSLLTLSKWLRQGKIKLATDMQHGFDNIPKTLNRLFTGANIGKQMLTITEPPLAKNSSWLYEQLYKLASLIK